jgi:MutS domain V
MFAIDVISFRSHSQRCFLRRFVIACAQGLATQMTPVRSQACIVLQPSSPNALTFVAPSLSIKDHNISTFMQEMKETAFICRNATSKSLLLIDELGRATSNEDGVALAWAVSECLLQSGALTFFVTHYPQVTSLGHENMYTSVQNQHLEATVSTNAEEGGEIAYTHKVKKGHCTVGTSYGIDLAYACGWPEDVLRNVSHAVIFHVRLRMYTNAIMFQL